MTLPRPIVPDATYLVTRRVLRRHHLFRPDPDINRLFIYALAVCAERYGVRVHAFCVMSNHVHIVLTDCEAKLPTFLQQFHRSVALATKELRRWEGPVWDRASTSVVRLDTPAAVAEKIGYTLANPVAAGLVRVASEWPGAKSEVEDIGAGRHAAPRPEAYFASTNAKWPDHATLDLALPPSVPADAAESFRALAREVLARQEREARASVEALGRQVLGARRVLRSSPYDRATTFEPLRGRNPTFATAGINGAFAGAAAALRAFRESYRVALESWRAGVRSVVFPIGTWWMARCHGVLVAT